MDLRTPGVKNEDEIDLKYGLKLNNKLSLTSELQAQLKEDNLIKLMKALVSVRIALSMKNPNARYSATKTKMNECSRLHLTLLENIY